MRRNSFLKLTMLVLLVGSAFALDDSPAKSGSTSTAHRDWTKHPVVLQVDTAEDILAVGDAHADPTRLLGVLVEAKIIEGVPKKSSEISWSAGKSVLVVTGDMIDKWHHSLKVIALLRALQKDAASKGGQVIVTMGNHEAEFLADPTGKKTKDFSDELIAAGIKPQDVASCQGSLGKFLCELPIAARVNDWFFCHAGNTNNQSIPDLSAAIESGFKKHGFATKQLVGDNSLLEARLNDKGPGGLPWFDNGSSSTDPQKLLAQYAAALGVKHIVQGHQPGSVDFPDGKNRSKEDLFQRYGLLFLIDGGMSKGIEGSTSTGGALRISGTSPQTVVATCANGQTMMLWDSSTNPDLNEIHCGK
ncbi:MAG TPA: metallophosphoesterase [Candidatus Saccharimonadales bacterium]|jgi:hypothetical protein|nr:metallophosphoesterase [Candidatus Saccharimonadales bacterium]